MMTTQYSELPLDAKCYVVKITVSMLRYHGIVEETVYYRRQLSLNLLIRWQWYFEYLAALVKVHNPHRRVELFTGNDKWLTEQEEIEKSAKSRLSRKLAQIKRLKGEVVQDDLFGFAQAKHDKKIERIQGEIESIQRGEHNFLYYMPEYKNNIKKWIAGAGGTSTGVERAKVTCRTCKHRQRW